MLIKKMHFGSINVAAKDIYFKGMINHSIIIYLDDVIVHSKKYYMDIYFKGMINHFISYTWIMLLFILRNIIWIFISKE